MYSYEFYLDGYEDYLDGYNKPPLFYSNFYFQCWLTGWLDAQYDYQDLYYDF